MEHEPDLHLLEVSPRPNPDHTILHDSSEPRPHENDIPCADEGRQAWTVLIAAFVFEAVLWGFPLSFGVSQSYYSSLPQFANKSAITYVGTLSTGITYLGAPFSILILRRFPEYQSHLIWLGWALCIVGLVAGSFAHDLPTLIMTQGVVYGSVRVLSLFYPVINIVSSWWINKRGFAWGIMIGSSGANGVIYPFVIESLLAKYGYPTTLRSLAVAAAVLTGPLLPFLKSRRSTTHERFTAATGWSFTRSPQFWFYTLASAIQSLGFYMPSLFLPTYALSLGLSPRFGATLLAILSATQVVGQVTYGWLSDHRLSLNALLASTGAIGAISSLTLWAFAKSDIPLIFFALIYGFFAYAFMAMRVRMGTAVTTDRSSELAIFCIFSFVQGIGNILAGPLSEALLDSMGSNIEEQEYARYKPLIYFTGFTLMASAATIAVPSVVVSVKNILH